MGNVFYSRRIQNPDWGVKLIGTSGSNNYAYLAAMDNTADGKNPVFNVLRFQRDIWSKSSMGVIGVSKTRKGDKSSGALATDMRFVPSDHDEISLALMATGIPEQNRDSWAARAEYSRRADPWFIGSGYFGMGKDFSVDQFGSIDHDAGIRSHEAAGALGYIWHIGSRGIDSIEFLQEGSASKRSDDDKWGWRWDNVDISLNLINRAFIAFWHDSWLIRYQGEGFQGDDYNLRIRTPPGWRVTGEVRYTDTDQIEWSDTGVVLSFGKAKRIQTGLTFRAAKSLVFEGNCDIARKYFRETRTDKVGWLSATYTPTRNFFVRSFMQGEGQRDVLQANLLFAYQYGPLSWIYLAYNNSLDTTGKWQAPDRWRSTDQMAILKVTRLISQ